MAGTKNTKNAKKKARKNSNYKTVVKYVDVDQLMRKSLCDYRNMPKPDPEIGPSPVSYTHLEKVREEAT